jgi:hypothetical protein
MHQNKKLTRFWSSLFFASLLLLGACNNGRQSKPEDSENKPADTPTLPPIDQQAYLVLRFQGDNSQYVQMNIKEMTDNPNHLQNIWAINGQQVGIRKIGVSEKLSFYVDLGPNYPVALVNLRYSEDCRLQNPNTPYELTIPTYFFPICGPTGNVVDHIQSYGQGDLNVIF